MCNELPCQKGFDFIPIAHKMLCEMYLDKPPPRTWDDTAGTETYDPGE